MTVRFIFLSLFLLAFGSQARNTNNFQYFGVSVQSQSLDDVDFLGDFSSADISPMQYSTDDSSLAFRGVIGHNFNQYIGVELGFSNYAKSEFSITQTVTAEDGTETTTEVYSGKFKTSSADVRANFTYPVSDNMFLKAHLGVVAWDNETTYLRGTLDALNTQAEKETGLSPTYGVGVGFGIAKDTALTLELEKTKVAEVEVQTISLSLLLRF